MSRRVAAVLGGWFMIATVASEASDHCTPLLISGGKLSSYMVSLDGAAWSWGNDSVGQLGRGGGGPAQLSSRPQDQIAVSSLTNLAAGEEHVLALDSSQRLWSWGRNERGQLGDGSGLDSNRPIEISVSFVPTFIGAGRFHSLAVDETGGLWAWGFNGYGQLGDGTATDSPVPIQVQGIGGVREAVAGNGHTLALLDSGELWAWGMNSSGQLGDGTQMLRLLPQRVPGMDSVVRAAAGFHHSVALRADGTVWVWGDGRAGQLGDGRWSVIQTTPQQVAGLSSIVDIASGMEHVVAVRADGRAFLWGGNIEGQLGLPHSQLEATPQFLSSVSGVVGAACGEEHTLLLTATGALFAMGSNSAGELGDGNIHTGRWMPEAIDFDFQADDLGNALLAARLDQDVLITLSGALPARAAVYADDSKDRLGNTAVSPVPVPPGWVHSGAMTAPPALLFYRERALSACTLTPGP